MTALDALGLRPVGFRPPGGELTDASLGLLREFGFEYCSPLGTEVETRDGILLLPFRWELVDALYYLPHFASLRGTDEILPPERLREAIDAALEGFAVLIFHPFLLQDEERFEVLRWASGAVVAACRECPGRRRVLTGTPAGVGYRRDPKVLLRDGDRIVVEIERVGRLENTVAAE